MKRTWLSIGALLVAACVAAPRPRVMEEVDSIRADARSKQAERLAPQAFLAAEQRRREAMAAADSDDRAAAQILGEHAVAAYNRAFALARLAKAEERLASAKRELSTSEKALAELDAEQVRIAAEADDLEMRVKVARDALPLVPNEPASPERERARREAALAISLQARLLCTAARLLSGKEDALSEELGAIDSLERTLATAPKVTPIDEAMRLRSRCLGRLTEARRPAALARPEVSAGDELLAKLSAQKLAPSRDERGVVITLRDAFRADALAARARETLESLAQVAREHPQTPVLVVAHSARGATAKKDGARAAAAADALREAGAPRVGAVGAGAAQPVVPNTVRGAAARNERLEVVFVTPAW